MRYCQRCGSHITRIGGTGGCGGAGSKHGCPICDIVYVQTNGGIASSLEGPQYKIDESTTYYGEIYKEVEQSLRQCNWGIDEGRWFWVEENGFDAHYYDTEEEARIARDAHLDNLEEDFPYPDCPNCCRKTRPLFRLRNKFRCPACDTRVVEEEQSV